MLGFISRLGSSKGMVLVPNFAGLNSSAANNQLSSVGLVLNPLSGEIATNNSAQGGIGLTQFPAAGTLVDYETPIIINFGKFVADTVTVSPCQGYTIPTNDSDFCSGTLYVYGATRTKNRKTVTTTNNVTGTSTITYDYSCADTVVDRGSAYLDGQCGHVVAPVTCTATASTTETTCNAAYTIGSSGTFTRTTSGTDSACNPYSSSVSIKCWQYVCNAWSAWDTLPSDTNKERRGRLCQYTDGSTKVEEQQRCKTTYVITYGGCGSNGKKIQTTKKYVCGKWQSTTTSSVPCNAI
jgi:hypothetical protein